MIKSVQYKMAMLCIPAPYKTVMTPCYSPTQWEVAPPVDIYSMTAQL